MTDADATEPFHAAMQQGFNEVLGLRYDDAGPDRVVLSFDITPSLHQPYGMVHGGVWCAAVETAASMGAGMWWGERGNVVGVSNHTDFLRAAREGTVVVTATPIHRGRLQQLWLVELREADGDERMLARGQVRLQNLESADALGR